MNQERIPRDTDGTPLPEGTVVELALEVPSPISGSTEKLPKGLVLGRVRHFYHSNQVEVDQVLVGKTGAPIDLIVRTELIRKTSTKEKEEEMPEDPGGWGSP